jgi:hypothetical protein
MLSFLTRVVLSRRTVKSKMALGYPPGGREVAGVDDLPGRRPNLLGH